MTPTLRTHFADYAAFHRTPGNQACHYVGIPLIVLSILSLLSQVTAFTLAGYPLTLAAIALALITAYYLTLDVGLALFMLVIAAVMIALGSRIPVPWAIGLFVLGWIFQYLGHYAYEKKSPAFYKNLTHLLIGPLWILAKALGRA